MAQLNFVDWATDTSTSLAVSDPDALRGIAKLYADYLRTDRAKTDRAAALAIEADELAAHVGTLSDIRREAARLALPFAGQPSTATIEDVQRMRQLNKKIATAIGLYSVP